MIEIGSDEVRGIVDAGRFLEKLLAHPASFVIALDPGLTTGLAWAYAGLGRDMQSIVVAERFQITANTARNTDAPWSLKVNGMAEFLAYAHDALYREQMPSEAKRFSTDARLRDAGWNVHGDHARDAARHLYLFLVRRGDLPAPAPGVV